MDSAFALSECQGSLEIAHRIVCTNMFPFSSNIYLFGFAGLSGSMRSLSLQYANSVAARGI